MTDAALPSAPTARRSLNSASGPRRSRRSRRSGITRLSPSRSTPCRSPCAAPTSSARRPTGTGKTLGFGVPLLDRVIAPAEGADGLPQALVVVPTRELGLQVARDIAAAGRTRGVRVLPIYGGVAYEPQVDALTQGRRDRRRHARPAARPGQAASSSSSARHPRRWCSTRPTACSTSGFLDDVEKILAMLPEERQTMLFSATMPDPIVDAGPAVPAPPGDHPRRATTPTTGPSPLTKQVVYRTHPMNKIEVVARILQAEGRGLTMIFTRTKRAADRVAEDLDFRGFAVAAVHGDLGQGARERALRAFRAGKIDVLVATDVAARGLDVSGVTHVINYDCPEDPDTYTHRIGRTGRAGATGVAVTFVDWEDMPRWRLIDKTLGLDMPEPPETYHTSARALHRPGHPDRRHRHAAHRRTHPRRPGRRGRGGPGRRSRRRGRDAAAGPTKRSSGRRSAGWRRARRRRADHGPGRRGYR